MRFSRWLWGVAGIVVVAGIVLVTQLTAPQESPAFAVATTFVNAAENGDETTAFLLLSPTLQRYAQVQCPNGRASDCIQSYSPPEWGKLVSAVFRRSAPDGNAWDVEVIATYEQDTGVSGVCSALHVAQNAEGEWQIERWAGFIWCGDPASRNMAGNPDAPNRAP
jgi:hypothetical protein